MNNFTFENSTKVFFGINCVDEHLASKLSALQKMSGILIQPIKQMMKLHFRELMNWRSLSKKSDCRPRFACLV